MQTGSSFDFSDASPSSSVLRELYWLAARCSDVVDGFQVVSKGKLSTYSVL
jgi:hypothetical protein